MASTTVACTRQFQWSSAGGEDRRKPSKTPPMIAIRWRHKAFAIASVQGGDIGNGGNNNIGALELNTLFDDLQPEIAFKDTPSLPKPLSVSDVSGSVNGSRLRVAYQVVECWLVDRAVLPIENSLGGSIHCNYDLLLHHKLHIVREVKYAVRHCLLANPGVKKEDLKRVLSHPQALTQCEHTLTKLVVREAVDDTVGAAKGQLPVHWLLKSMVWIFLPKISRMTPIMLLSF
uniref:Arogenate dehydratase/prephenate dehydratase 2, chloroplastic-like isoform X2 n=1 Tax=Elaeis guineensis var. tenera TaxID=51953 RepID=A0A8N4EYQ3_ELAGV|nr:arogenate dehydratase/prephenate dehydratase 2, chloroplastic-like isoform X2 [Elaeis guineensis]XP_029117363.1 arogenate dehydratase/prephenate dehydratase 2, chloroplastic-like isoform X2 [Elaeis guineensis]XP_029117364.1 arogenate dehydratase/prephenate dehydratase 2, chloroplastic-like isoform X2 [Elaeis guineensis]XP_029117365.1 arogenate dehydratase/prephenate dehydratase 2, chloroplastic-like isoform X2 [Elaeis guineensis]